MNTKCQGDIAEILTQAACLEKGWDVLTPVGDNNRYDLVIDKGDGFERVQVKSSSLKNGCIKAYTRSIYNSTTKSTCKQYHVNDIDSFVIFCKDTKLLYYIKAEEFADDAGYFPKQINLRVEPSKNGQTTGVKLAQDYLF